MASWKEILGRIVVDAERHFDELKYRLHYALGGPGPIKIVPYRGFGTQERLFLAGRVLEDKEIEPARDNDGIWDNLVNMYKRMESDEVPRARIVARFQGIEREVVADVEGMFEVWIEPRDPLTEHPWQEIELELIEPKSDRQVGPVRAKGAVHVPANSARFAVISDIDDTVIRTDVANLWKMARSVFLGNARTRAPFPGVAAFYRALHAGASGDDKNPMFYVSSSPWNLYDLLAEFFHLQEIPNGPILFLRNWGISEEEILPLGHHKHKLRAIHQLMDTYTDLPFILIGDSGQHDPEIYQEVVETYPNRVLAVYIRNVSRDLDRPEAIRALAEKVAEVGSALVLADDSLAMARHAVSHQWIAPEAFADLEAEAAKDAEPPSVLERLLGGEGEGEAEPPTIEVDEPTAEGAAEKVREGAVETALDEGREHTKEPPTVIIEGDERKIGPPDRSAAPEPPPDRGAGPASDADKQEESGEG